MPQWTVFYAYHLPIYAAEINRSMILFYNSNLVPCILQQEVKWLVCLQRGWALQNIHAPGQVSLMLVQVLEQGMYVS